MKIKRIQSGNRVGYHAEHVAKNGKIYFDISPTREQAIETVLLYIARDNNNQSFISSWFENNIPY